MDVEAAVRRNFAVRLFLMARKFELSIVLKPKVSLGTERREKRAHAKG